MMDDLRRIITQTPAWVWPLFAYLLYRGIRARKPGDTTLLKLAVIPVVFTIWGLADLIRLYGLKPSIVGLWLVGIAFGAIIGWQLIVRQPIRANRATGTIWRPADYTLLPLLVLIFVIKYTFGFLTASSPDLVHYASFVSTDLIISGVVTGIFIGKFIVYWRSFYS